MVPFTAWRSTGSGLDETAAWRSPQLHYRVAGVFNDGDPVADVEWAISRSCARRFGDVPVCLVGHSMGARSLHPLQRAPTAWSPWRGWHRG